MTRTKAIIIAVTKPDGWDKFFNLQWRWDDADLGMIQQTLMTGSTMDSNINYTIDYYTIDYTTSVNDSNYKNRRSIRLGITNMLFRPSFSRERCSNIGSYIFYSHCNNTL